MMILAYIGLTFLVVVGVCYSIVAIKETWDMFRGKVGPR